MGSFDFAVRQPSRPPASLASNYRARQIAAVPLCANVVQLPEQPPLDQMHGVVVEHAVMTLMPGGQIAIVGRGHTCHLLARADVVGHQLLGQHVLAGLHGRDGDRRVQMQRQRDDHRLDVGILQQVLVVLVHLHMLRASSSVFQP